MDNNRTKIPIWLTHLLFQEPQHIFHNLTMHKLAHKLDTELRVIINPLIETLHIKTKSNIQEWHPLNTLQVDNVVHNNQQLNFPQ